MATRSSVPAWKIPWTGEPGRLQSTRSQRGGHDRATHTFTCPLLFIFSSGAVPTLLFSHSVMSDSAGPWTVHARFSCCSLSPRVCSDSCPLSQWCNLTISYSAALFSFCFQSFPTSRFFFFSQWVSSSHQVAKILELQFQHQSFQ